MNCIAPGHIPTGITSYDLGPTIEADQPLQRQGSPQDVAEAVLFLAGDRSAQITGIVVPVDGGTVAGRPVPQAVRGPAHQGEPGRPVETAWSRPRRDGVRCVTSAPGRPGRPARPVR